MKISVSIAVSFLVFFASCTYTQKIKDAKTAIDREQYAVAIPFFERDFKNAERKTQKAKIAYELASAYEKIGNNYKALEWYKTSVDNGNSIDGMKAYAQSLKKVERYQEAIEAFEELGLEIGSPYEFRKDITSCKVAQDWVKNPTQEVRLEGMSFNSESNEFAAVPYKNKQLFFTSDRPTSSKKDKYAWTGRSFMHFYKSSIEGTNVEKYYYGGEEQINEGTASFNPDFSEIYFTRCNGDVNNVAYCKIFHSALEGENWSVPKALEFQIEGINYINPSISEDEDFLFFAADDPNGWGGYDLYVSERSTEGWYPPVLLSRSINTEKDEAFPYIHNDTLYFASKGHTGMGGFDLFKSYKMNGENWTPAFNLKPPFNSGADDFAYCIDDRIAPTDKILQTGYISSNRVNQPGGDNVYKFEKIKEVKDTTIDKPEIPLVYEMWLNGYVLEKIYAIPDNPNSKILGRRPLANAEVEIQIKGLKNRINSDENGFFELKLEEQSEYTFLASKADYLNRQERFSTIGIAKDPNQAKQIYELEIVLDKIYKDKEIVLENIYYDFDQWNIRPDAKPTLNKLADILYQNPEIIIQLGSHTDCRGNDDYNQDLSQKRAQSAVDYLISKGIAAGRLSAKGYGESTPAVDCGCSRCSEEEHQINRRTTFKIQE